MPHPLLYPISGILALGILGQWFAWFLRLPSIFVLLIFGLIAGPVLGVVNPDQIFGPALFPLLSIAVSIILFEGGLTLKLGEFRKFGLLIRALCTIGVLVTFILSTTFAYLILGFSFRLSMLTGAILIVTGPTVIIPLLRYVKPTEKMSFALRWEGIVTDPIGAVLAVLVFEAITVSGLGSLPTIIFLGMLKTLLIGGICGAVISFFLLFLMERRLVPIFLENGIVLVGIVGGFTLSNYFQNEAGLLTATLMGFIFANQKRVSVVRLLEFKENLRVLLLAVLFIVLAARLNAESIKMVGVEGVYFLLALIFLVRPLAVFASTFGMKDVTLQEKFFLSFVCPRGVVAAAVSSLFSLELAAAGVPGAESLGVVIFMVILGTVTFYGLLSRAFASLLGLSAGEAQGVLIVGAHRFAREMARRIQEAGFPALLVDTNSANVASAESAGLNAVQANILDDEIPDSLPLDGIDKLLAATSNEEVNALACIRFSRIFDPSKVFKVRPDPSDSVSGQKESSAVKEEGRYILEDKFTFSVIEEKVKKPAVIAPLSPEEFSADQTAVPVFIVTKGRKLVFVTGRKDAARSDAKSVFVIKSG